MDDRWLTERKINWSGRKKALCDSITFFPCKSSLMQSEFVLITLTIKSLAFGVRQTWDHSSSLHFLGAGAGGGESPPPGPPCRGSSSWGALGRAGAQETRCTVWPRASNPQPQQSFKFISLYSLCPTSLELTFYFLTSALILTFPLSIFPSFHRFSAAFIHICYTLVPFLRSLHWPFPTTHGTIKVHDVSQLGINAQAGCCSQKVFRL